MRWARQVVIMGRTRIRVGFWSENWKEGDNMKDLETGGKIILKWILEK
jgi:hypothetical protein